LVTGWAPTAEDVERALTSTHRMRASARPQWRDVRQRLESLGIDLVDVVLSEWVPEGQHLMGGILATRDERVFSISVVYDYDANGQVLQDGQGWISAWKEIPSEEVGTTSSGYPNIWAAALMIARLVLEIEAQT
jgi:hypothetical protein